MSAHYPKQFQINGFDSMSEDDRRQVWETLKSSMTARGMIEIRFSGVKSPSRLRNEIYQHFGGYEIQFHMITLTSAHILIGPEKIRTSVTPTPTGTDRTKHPEELKRHEEIPAGFDFEPEEAAEVGQIARLCPVCERRLPLTAFNRSGKGRIQSYCIECNRAYQKWRYATLCKLGVERLTPDVTEGHRKRNERFHAWFKTYQGE